MAPPVGGGGGRTDRSSSSANARARSQGERARVAMGRRARAVEDAACAGGGRRAESVRFFQANSSRTGSRSLAPDEGACPPSQAPGERVPPTAHVARHQRGLPRAPRAPTGTPHTIKGGGYVAATAAAAATYAAAAATAAAAAPQPPPLSQPPPWPVAERTPMPRWPRAARCQARGPAGQSRRATWCPRAIVTVDEAALTPHATRPLALLSWPP